MQIRTTRRELIGGAAAAMAALSSLSSWTMSVISISHAEWRNPRHWTNRDCARARGIDDLVRGRRGLIHQGLERFGLEDSEVGEDLAIDLDPCALQPADKSAIGKAVLAHRGIDALDPERAKIPLPQLAPDIGMLHRAIDRRVRGRDVVPAPAVEAFRLF